MPASLSSSSRTACTAEVAWGFVDWPELPDPSVRTPTLGPTIAGARS